MCPPEEGQRSSFLYEMLPDVLIYMALRIMNMFHKDKLNQHSYTRILQLPWKDVW
jgi:hypothetical protein